MSSVRTEDVFWPAEILYSGYLHGDSHKRNLSNMESVLYMPEIHSKRRVILPESGIAILPRL